MMSCTVSAAWSHYVSSPCYTEHGQHCDVVLLGHITTVAMSKSDQLCQCCTVELNCSGMSARLTDASVTHYRVNYYRQRWLADHGVKVDNSSLRVGRQDARHHAWRLPLRT
jgi:hypothetical protein